MVSRSDSIRVSVSITALQTDTVPDMHVLITRLPAHCISHQSRRFRSQSSIQRMNGGHQPSSPRLDDDSVSATTGHRCLQPKQYPGGGVMVQFISCGLWCRGEWLRAWQTVRREASQGQVQAKKSHASPDACSWSLQIETDKHDSAGRAAWTPCLQGDNRDAVCVRGGIGAGVTPRYKSVAPAHPPAVPVLSSAYTVSLFLSVVEWEWGSE